MDTRIFLKVYTSLLPPLPPCLSARDVKGGKGVSGEAFLLTVGAFFLTVKLLCLQSLKALIRRTFPL